MKKIFLAAPIILCLLISCSSSSSEQTQTQDPAPTVEAETEDVEDDNDEDEEPDEDEDETAGRENRNQTRNTSRSATPSDVTADDFKIDDDMTARIEKTRRQHLGYVFIGSKKELKRLHLLTRKTIFSKRKLSMVNADLNTFQRIKTNTFTTLRIPGKSAKVLSDMPKDSYTITQSGDDCVLKVTDAMAFWQNCNYLVIQSKEDVHNGEIKKTKKKKKDYSKLKETAGTVAETAGVVALSLIEGYVTQNILVEIATQVLGQTELGRTAIDVVEKTTNGKQKIEDLKETFSDAKSKISNLRTKLKDVKLRKSTIEKELKKKGLSINSDLKDLKKALSKEQFKELKSVLKDETKLSEKLKKLESKK